MSQFTALLVAEPTRNRQMLATLDFARCQLALRRGDLAQARADLTAAEVALTRGLGAGHPDTVAARDLLTAL